MTYEAIEKEQVSKQLDEILEAANSHPGSKSYILDEITLKDLCEMAQFVGRRINFTFQRPDPFEDFPSGFWDEN